MVRVRSYKLTFVAHASSAVWWAISVSSYGYSHGAHASFSSGWAHTSSYLCAVYANSCWQQTHTSFCLCEVHAILCCRVHTSSSLCAARTSLCSYELLSACCSYELLANRVSESSTDGIPAEQGEGLILHAVIYQILLSPCSKYTYLSTHLSWITHIRHKRFVWGLRWLRGLRVPL